MTDSNARLSLLEQIAKLATELCVAVDREAVDIGGSRHSLVILQEIGPLTSQLEQYPDGVQPSDLPRNTLEVGLSKDMRDVVVNHPYLPLDPRGGHLVFTPQQARDFASSLILKADQAQAPHA